MPEPVENAKQFPEIFYARHMLPGIAGYDSERIMIDADAMKRAASSMVGKPVYVQHQKVALDTIEQDADGWVTDCFYNELDGWLWAKCLAVSDEAHRALAAGWSVSNAYVPIDWEGEGQHLNVDYTRKIRNYKFTHLAIVPNPRYEEAKTFTPDQFKDYQEKKRKELDELHNSKPPKKGHGLMFFRAKREEVKAGEDILDTDMTEITNADGTKETVTVAQLKEAHRQKKADEVANAKKNEKKCDDDDEVDVDGEKVNMGALKECYASMKREKKNAEEMAKKKAADEEKENAEKEEEKKKEEEKENSKRQKKVDEISNAGGKKIASAPVRIETISDKVARGKKLFG